MLSLRLSSIILPDGKEAVSLSEIVVCRLTKIMRAVWEGGERPIFLLYIGPIYGVITMYVLYFITLSNLFPALQEITTNPILALMQI